MVEVVDCVLVAVVRQGINMFTPSNSFTIVSRFSVLDAEHVSLVLPSRPKAVTNSLLMLRALPTFIGGGFNKVSGPSPNARRVTLGVPVAKGSVSSVFNRVSN